MSWADRTIWWHVYPLGFTGSPVRDHADGGYPIGGWAHLTRWLDYAVELGVNGLLLGPVFAAESHGYDTLDHRRIDPRLGTLADFDTFVAACRERGLRIVLDGVFNHVGRGHPWFAEAIAGGPRGSAAGDFQLDWTAPDDPRAEVFEGHDGLVRLNHSSERVVDEVVAIMTSWLDRGIDGWRLDAAYAVDPGFWARVLPRVRDDHPDAWIVGEVIHGDYAGLVEASGMDSITQYELWKAIWSSLADRNLFELDWNLTRHNGFLERFIPNTFIGNHDVTRIATRVGPQAAVLALVVLLTTGGIPSIYYGDEQAFTGVKEDRLGGDDAVRPAFPASPADLAGDGAWMLRTHQSLIGLRRRNAWLVTARTQSLLLTNTRYEYVTRSADGEHSLTVLLDLDGETPRAEIRDAQGVSLFAAG